MATKRAREKKNKNRPKVHEIAFRSTQQKRSYSKPKETNTKQPSLL